MFTEIWRYVIATSEWQDLERNSTCPTMSLQWRTFSPAVLTDLDSVLASQDSRHLRRLRRPQSRPRPDWSGETQLGHGAPRARAYKKNNPECEVFNEDSSLSESLLGVKDLRTASSSVGPSGTDTVRLATLCPLQGAGPWAWRLERPFV